MKVLFLTLLISLPALALDAEIDDKAQATLAKANRAELARCVQGTMWITCGTLTGPYAQLYEKLRPVILEDKKAAESYKNPEEKHPLKDPVFRDLLVKQEADIADHILKHFADACKNAKELCMEEDEKKGIEQDKNNSSCYFSRLHQLYNSPKADEQAFEEEISDESTKSKGKDVDCPKLLADDRKRFGMTEAVAVAPEVPAPKAAAEADDDEEIDFKPETCKWSQDLPRKVLACPGCEKGTDVWICTGYVICDPVDDSKPKLTRLSTCSSGMCGNKDAVSCTRQQGYSSSKAEDAPRKTPSKKVKTAVGVTKE